MAGLAHQLTSHAGVDTTSNLSYFVQGTKCSVEIVFNLSTGNIASLNALLSFDKRRLFVVGRKGDPEKGAEFMCDFNLPQDTCIENVTVDRRPHFCVISIPKQTT